MAYRVAVVGATGNVGREMLNILSERRFPVNTWGGMMSAGQPGGPAGGLNGIGEAVLQLQHRAGDRQVKNAELAVTTGYGMTIYRYGGTAAAAVLERVP